MRIPLSLLFALPSIAFAAEPMKLEYSPAPVANPLKGLVPYAGKWKDRFPHSLEFDYLAYADLVKGYDTFEWKPLEKLLDAISSRGHQAVIRIYLEYPGKKNLIPKLLLDDGLKVHKYLNTNTAPEPPAEIETPDYEDKNLRKSLKNFLAAFGKKYDGDPRFGFITAGLLGTWGEWHTYPKDELFASKAVQVEVMDGYEAAFQKTPILLRYPAGEKTWGKATNAKRGFGYHDDSFAWATLDTGKKGDEWFYMTALSEAGPDAEAKWKTRPIGGEIRPEAWGHVFDEKPKPKEVQNFRKCVDATHATWLMDSGMFEKKQSAKRIARAEEEVRHMGYEFHVATATIGTPKDGKLAVSVAVDNRGVAPFYVDWPIEFALLDGGKAIANARSDGKLTGLLPGDKARTWSAELPWKEFVPATAIVALRVPNPLNGGLPIRFANATQDKDADGYLTLGSVGK